MGVAAVKLGLGVGLALLLLEWVLRANPGLLLHGMALPAPADPPLTLQLYAVRSSDADTFFWMRDRIRPIRPDEDQVEALVRFETDEYGFPNVGPVPADVDVVVLGRSYSLGAQASQPWPRALAERARIRVLNLSQAGSGIGQKTLHLRRFGLPRSPRWVVVEVLPSMDIIGFGRPEPLLIQRLVFPMMQYFARAMLHGSAPSPGALPIYPLQISMRGGDAQLVFFDDYLAALTVGREELTASGQWTQFTQGLVELTALARSRSACVALLLAPTKETVYLPLAAEPAQLEPALEGCGGWSLSGSGWLVPYSADVVSPGALQANAPGAGEALGEFSARQGILFLDPTSRFVDAVLAGGEPFMRYDTHWSALGHRLVADMVAEGLAEGGCR